MEAYKDAILAYAVYYPVVEVLSSIAIACIIWFGGGEVLRHMAVSSVALAFSWHRFPGVHLVQTVITLGTLVAFMSYAQRFFRPIQDLSEKYNILQSAMAAGERVFKLLDTEVEVTSPTVAKKATGRGRIEFEHVWFAYRSVPADTSSEASVGTGLSTVQAGQSPAATTSAPDWVLRDVTFAIEPGETVAVVGHTGAGKTTLISLLMRFYDVQQGSIRIDGVDIREMGLDDLRSRFGVVLQDPFLFTGTVEGNIRLGTTPHPGRRCRASSRRRESGGLHPDLAGWLQGRGTRARLHALDWTEAAYLVRPRAGARSQDPDPRRSDFKRRHRN